MSTAEEIPTEEKKRSPRRRPVNRRRRSPRKREEEGNHAEVVEENKESEQREPRPRPTSLPVPAELTGKTVTGIISAVVRKGRLRFGFIHIGDITKPEDEKPRIYFNFDEFADKSVTPRRGYVIQLTCSVDDKGRSYASAISLTEEGKVIAAEREAAIALKRAEKPAAPAVEGSGVAPDAASAPKRRSSSAPRERRPRERRVVEGKKINLIVSCVGHSEEKPIVVDLAQSIGKLKSNAALLFDAPNHYNIFHNDAFLTKAVLNTLQENDKIRLDEPKEVAAVSKADGATNGSTSAT